MANAPKRLSKVAKEINVGISTIAEFLSSKGYDIEAKPNTKISPDVYELLLEQYMPDKAAKEKSEELKKQKEVHTAISIEDKGEKKDDEDDEPFEERGDEILIKNVGTSEGHEKPEKEKQPEPQPEKPEEKKEEEPESEKKETEEKGPEIDKEVQGELSEGKEDGPRLVGKIDLDNLNLKSRPDNKKKKSKAEEEKKKAEKKKSDEEEKSAAKPAAEKESGQKEEKPAPPRRGEKRRKR